jgi:hypothetical protein
VEAGNRASLGLSVGRDTKIFPMAYRNKTFVSFASEDIAHYRLMTAWHANPRFDFRFQDAHDLNTALDTSQPETIRRRLRERLANTRQVVMLLGRQTRAVAGRTSRFLYYEVEVIDRLELPVVFVNLNGSRDAESARMPVRLETNYTLSVSFQPSIIKEALDDWVERFPRERRTKSGSYSYENSVYKRLGL